MGDWFSQSVVFLPLECRSLPSRSCSLEARESTQFTVWNSPAGSPCSDLVLFPSQLYESALTENQTLKTKLQEAQLELADIKSKLEKMAQQKQEKSSDRSSVLEMEKRERRALERKMSEMEEEMKV
ncbi:protein phosphatase 1 regulatory subunit 12B-like [Microtus ochrogaster]|uniref:Protein phosphatase 1 regulatory subunit 12B-like n=1 Tax=Microtus ochrogaster TaxID=79684 RepID=A0ABM1TX73_MICOH|nr:protein phosphatase 1 regulatory subunit 12B-like [Microtus ochrogaster]